MRVFDHPNTSKDWKCPICQKNTDKPVVLIGITGTEDDGIIEANQFHLECLEPLYYKDDGVIAMKLPRT